jgi:hypothetical protein
MKGKKAAFNSSFSLSSWPLFFHYMSLILLARDSKELHVQAMTDCVEHEDCIPETDTSTYFDHAPAANSTRNPISSRTQFPGAVAVGGIGGGNDDKFTFFPDVDEEQPAVFEAEAVKDNGPDRELFLPQMVLQEIETQLNQQGHVAGGQEVVQGELMEEEGDSSA